VAIAVGYAATGWAFGDTAWLWGLTGGLIAMAVLWAANLNRDPLLAAAFVVASTVGTLLFVSVVDDRSGPIDLSQSLRAGAGWLLPGLAFGYLIFKARPDKLRMNVVWLTGLAFFSGAVAALIFGEGIGYLDRLRPSQIEAGEIQVITSTVFLYTGLFAGAIGAAVGMSYIIGTPALASLALAGTFTLFALGTIEFSFGDLLSRFGALVDFLTDFWPPVWEWSRTVGGTPGNQIIGPMIETFQIAIVGATFGCLIALPIAFLASRPTQLNILTFWFSRMFMNLVRTVPDVFWAALFAASVGFNPLAGALAMLMFSIAIMAKLLSETVDAIEPGPLEATRAAGARHSQMVQYSALPQVLPNYVAYALYIFELNIRASVVIGLVGAGGIGRVLDEQRSFFQWDRVMAIVIVIFVAVVVIEAISVYTRRRIV
jgi:phosphonate transport system permease protein